MKGWGWDDEDGAGARGFEGVVEVKGLVLVMGCEVVETVDIVVWECFVLFYPF